MLIAKLAEKPSLRQRMAWVFVTFLTLIWAIMFIALIKVVGVFDKLRGPRRPIRNWYREEDWS